MASAKTGTTRAQHIFAAGAKYAAFLAILVSIQVAIVTMTYGDNIGSFHASNFRNATNDAPFVVQPQGILVSSNSTDASQVASSPLMGTEKQSEHFPEKIKYRIIKNNTKTTKRHKPLLCSKSCNANLKCTTNSMPLKSVYRKKDVLWKERIYVSKNWGNVLSTYWAVRTMAHLGGYEYGGKPFGQKTWMEYLPTYAPKVKPQKILFEKVCATCDKFEFFHEGSCSYGWGHMAPQVGHDTRHALLEYSKKKATKEQNKDIFEFFGPNDWLIYNRCCVLKNIHGVGVLRTYDSIPTEGEFNVFIMKGRREDPYRFCDIFIGESIEHMKKRNPKINVTILENASTYVDFARLVFAPNVLVASTGSSWTLWSAVMANNNTVVTLIPMIDASIEALDFPDNVKILVDVPNIPNVKKHEYGAKAIGLPFGEFSNTTEDRDKVLNYFRTA